MPTPRGGGIGFVYTSILAVCFYALINNYLFSAGFLVFLFAALVVALLGWLDDRYNLSRRVRFLVQVLASAAVLLFVVNLDIIKLPALFEIHVGISGFLIGIVFIAGTTNIYNFMDGVDGIASVQLFGVASGWMILGWLWNEPLLFSINLILFISVLAFLIYNWSPAKIFMGDAGSLYLGFICASMPFLGAYISDAHEIRDTLWYGLLLLWPFLFDGTFTLFRRFFKGENIFKAHRSHLYQRLNILGVSHSKISLLYLTFSIIVIPFTILFTLSNEFYKLIIILLILFLSFSYVYTVMKLEKTSRLT